MKDAENLEVTTMLLRTRVHQFDNKVYLTKSGIWALGLVVPKKNNVLGVLEGECGRLLIPARNLVTDAGDVYYAGMMAGESPTNNGLITEDGKILSSHSSQIPLVCWFPRF